jgi:hypothetical protein
MLPGCSRDWGIIYGGSGECSVAIVIVKAALIKLTHLDLVELAEAGSKSNIAVSSEESKMEN